MLGQCEGDGGGCMWGREAAKQECGIQQSLALGWIDGGVGAAMKHKSYHRVFSHRGQISHWLLQEGGQERKWTLRDGLSQKARLWSWLHYPQHCSSFRTGAREGSGWSHNSLWPSGLHYDVYRIIKSLRAGTGLIVVNFLFHLAYRLESWDTLFLLFSGCLGGTSETEAESCLQEHTASHNFSRLEEIHETWSP